MAEACGRRCHVVKGEAATYSVFAGFCSCRNFASRLKMDTPYCKHIVAVKLAEATQQTVRRTVSDKDFASYILR